MANINLYGLQNSKNCENSAILENAYCKVMDGKRMANYNRKTDADWFHNHYTCPPFYYETKELGTECSTPGLAPQSSFEFQGKTVTICAGIVEDATTGGAGNCA